jgi:carbon-monoxide dehydrogenase medium subunit
LRASEAEAVLIGSSLTDARIAEAAAALAAATSPVDDIHAGAAYRRRMAGVLTRRALTVAVGTITKGAAA